jgi:hypothetical protein
MYATFIVTNVPIPCQNPTAISSTWIDAQTFRLPNKCYTRPTYNASLKPQIINSDLESWNSLNTELKYIIP